VAGAGARRQAAPAGRRRVGRGGGSAKTRRLGEILFRQAAAPKIVSNFRSDVTNLKTNAVNKSDEKACEWVFLSALVALEKRAKQLGANAVVNIVSYYKKVPMSSETEYECHAGNVLAGVALKGDFVKVAER